jgi:type I restriction enzyme, S subunit
MNNGLPKDWKWTTCGELAAKEANSIMDGPFGSKLKTEHYTDRGARVIRLGNIQPMRFIEEDKAFISMKYFEQLRAHEVRAGDLLIAALGDPLGRACRAPSGLGPAIVKADCLRYRPAASVDADYLVYWLNSPEGRKSIEALSHGIGRKRINTQDLRDIPVPVGPIDQQRKIVAELDNIFVRAKLVKGELRKIPNLVQHYNKALLGAAFCGKLTGDNAEQWPIVRLGDVIAEIDAGKNLKCEERPPHQSELGILKVSSVTWGTFDPLEAKTTTADLDQRNRIRTGDFLISRANTLELVGACVIVGPLPNDNLYLSDKVLRIRFTQPIEKWVLYLLRSMSGRAQIEALTVGNQLSMRNISQASLRAIRIPLPSDKVRNRVLRCLEGALEGMAKSLSEVILARDFIARFDQAILAKAFRGELPMQVERGTISPDMREVAMAK